jgi:endonuclease/exonuclease/phosphatase family metal-dependent hydrolase
MELTIVTFNTHGGMRPPHRGRCEPYDLLAVLRGIDADIVVLQEVFTPDDGAAVTTTLAAETGVALHELTFGRARFGPGPRPAMSHAGPGLASGTIGLAVLTRFPAEQVGRIGLGRVPGDRGWERGALHLRLDADGTTLDVVGLHLSSRLPHGPPLQLGRLRGRLPAAGSATVVAGDFNFWGPGVTSLLPGWRRAVRGRTWPAARPHSQIDHVLVSPGVEVVDAEILPDVGSDHRPVRARLCVTPPAEGP